MPLHFYICKNKYHKYGSMPAEKCFELWKYMKKSLQIIPDYNFLFWCPPLFLNQSDNLLVKYQWPKLIRFEPSLCEARSWFSHTFGKSLSCARCHGWRWYSHSYSHLPSRARNRRRPQARHHDLHSFVTTAGKQGPSRGSSISWGNDWHPDLVKGC